MKSSVVIFLVSILFATALATEQQGKLEQQTMDDLKLTELESLPEGIKVVHTPSSALATWDGSKELKYTWTYKTTVESLAGFVTVEEFGMYFWDGNRWVFGNVTTAPFTKKDFAEWYSCPGSKILQGCEFSDPSNWSSSGCLQDGKARWYFIGTDEQGGRVKGEATFEQLGRFQE